MDSSKILVTGASGNVGARKYTDLKKSLDVVGTYYHNKSDDLVKMDIAKSESVCGFPGGARNPEQEKLVKDLNYMEG